MQWILGVFAMAYNRRMGLSGHVWGERFFSRIIEGLWDYLYVFGYIDSNPVKAGLARHGWLWEYGGLGHARRGWRHILDPAPEWVLLLFPDHRPRRLL
jgi:putative transposase